MKNVLVISPSTGTLQIPSFDVFSGRKLRLEDYWDQALCERFNRAYYQTYRAMRLFPDENGVTHKMVDEMAAAKHAARPGRMSASLREAPAPTVTGYVEAMTATAALGWAWTQGDAEPLTVELRLAEQVVAEAVADELREDLARSGIGSGRHAFTLPVPESFQPRLAELRVYARTKEGKLVPLGAPPAEDGVAERLANLQRGLEMVVGSQRLLHRNLQAALLKQEGTTPLTGTAATQTALQESIATLEIFVARLEQSLAAHPAPTQAPPRRVALAGVAATALLALLASLWALARTMLG